VEKKRVEIFENITKNKVRRRMTNSSRLDDMFVISDMHLKDISSTHLAKEIKRINLTQRMILATTSPFDAVKKRQKK